jgi:myo-inositol-1(or 4)-monophosphatase
VEGQRRLFAEHASIAERTVFEGVGEGGDQALAIDRRCEDLVFSELEPLAERGLSFTAISEERGEVCFGDPEAPLRVVIDPIDGSMNARRTLPTHCLSVAIASGPSMADVELGFIHDFGTGEEFTAERGAGARLDGRPLRAEGPGRGLEVVGLESTNPDWLLETLEALQGRAWRVRAVGAIAATLSYVAAGRFDAMLTARACRSVDAAAAQLIAREAGALVEFGGGVSGAPALDLDAAPLDLDARYRLVAALDAEMLEAMREVRDAAPTKV